jgi:hypothetical protein
MYNYWGYGLTIASEIEFPELLSFDFEIPDVTIRLGKTPETLTGDDVVHKVNLCMGPTQYLLRLLNIANYYAANGISITVEPTPGIDDKSIRLFLLSSVMAAILHQRGTIALHASAIEHGGGVILFCGKSGAGKSTTATMLHQKGYKVFSDDVCVLKAEGDLVTAIPSYPMMKLWEDSFAKAGIPMVEEAQKIRPELAKYGRFFHDDFDIQPRAVKKIFLLDTDRASKEVSISSLRAVDAFKELQANTYRPAQTVAMKKRDIHFAIVSKLTAAAKVYKVTRPESTDTLAQVIDLITQALNGHG